jgi:ATP-dependent Zn protease
MRTPKKTADPSIVKKKSVSKRMSTAYHEAGHAVLSAAINDSPRLVSIRESDNSLGRNQYRMEGRPVVRMQVHLAGFAAEELLKGHRPRRFSGHELGLSVLAATDPSLASAADVDPGMKSSDQYMAVQELLAMGCTRTEDAINTEIERFYAIAKESLAAVWPAVVAVAKALLKHSELDSEGFFTAIQGQDIFGPIHSVQRAHGLHFRV